MGTLCRGGGVIADTLCYEEGEGCYDGIPWAQNSESKSLACSILLTISLNVCSLR